MQLICAGCGAAYDPPRWHCRNCSGLLRSVYATRTFSPKDIQGLFAFSDWLPSQARSSLPLGTVIVPAERLGDALGVPELWLAFSGYAPPIGARNPTGSFKDFEATPTLLHLREHGIESLVLASAGNTARAFAYAATILGYPVVLVVPERALQRLWLPVNASDAVRLVVIEGSDDYALAIRVAAILERVLDLPNEGGARNVARRDGMGTALLEFVRSTGTVPDHYVQAVGSGTGAIAIWEAAVRLIGSGIGARPPVLHLAQNAPFAPIHAAWHHGAQIRPEERVEEQRQRITQISATVLANRNPPYAIPGGVRDALEATSGHTYAVTNHDAAKAGQRFEECHQQLTLGPASAVAVGALEEAVAKGRIGCKETVMLHVTGNNERGLRREYRLRPIPVSLRLRTDELGDAAIRRAAQRAGIDPRP
jgi:cysteate synthase